MWYVREQWTRECERVRGGEMRDQRKGVGLVVIGNRVQVWAEWPREGSDKCYINIVVKLFE